MMSSSGPSPIGRPACFIHRLRRSRFWWSVGTLASGSAIAHLFGLLSLPLVTRLYAESDIGAVAVLVSIASLPTVLAGLRYDSALMICPGDDDVPRLAALAIATSLFMAAITLVVALLLRMGGYQTLAERPAWFSCAVFLLVVCGGWLLVLRTVRLRSAHYPDLAAATTWRAGVWAGTRIGGGAIGSGAAGLVLAEVLALLAALVRLHRKRPTLIRPMLRRLHLGEAWRVARVYSRFPLYEIPSTILDQAATIAPVIWISWRFGSEGAGLFAVAFRVATAGNATLGLASGDVFRSEYATLVREVRLMEARAAFLRVLRQLALLAVAGMALLILVVTPAFTLIFGERWAEAGRLLPWLALWAATGFIVSPVSHVLSLHGRFRVKMVYDAMSALLVAGTLAWCTANRASLSQSVALLAGAAVTANICYAILLGGIVIRCTRQRPPGAPSR